MNDPMTWLLGSAPRPPGSGDRARPDRPHPDHPDLAHLRAGGILRRSLSLFHLVPVVGPFIVMAVLAFSTWPNAAIPAGR